ncbi:MAG: DUF308 domain-containing protein [Promethearchaeota archaeon]|jgi:hypothetical protein
MIELIHKDKIRADDYISGFLVLSYIFFALFFRLEVIMSMLVYPFISLILYGISKIINGTNKRNRGNHKNLNRVLFGLLSIAFSVAFLNFFLTQPNVTFQNIITLAAYPILIVGFAGIIKGRYITAYSSKFRDINIVIGIITIVICTLALFSSRIFPPEFVVFHVFSLSITLVVNIVSRAALYLSEYNLSVLNLGNFKLFFYIISDYFIYISKDGNIVLNKFN